MHARRFLLVAVLVPLFLGLSFNAYACLVPLYGAAGATMGNGCSTPDEQSARQLCDAFKTLSVHATPELHPAIDCQTVCGEDTASLSLVLNLPSSGRYVYERPGLGPPQDLLLKTSVLRI